MANPGELGGVALHALGDVRIEPTMASRPGSSESVREPAAAHPRGVLGARRGRLGLLRNQGFGIAGEGLEEALVNAIDLALRQWPQAHRVQPPGERLGGQGEGILTG